MTPTSRDRLARRRVRRATTSTCRCGASSRRREAASRCSTSAPAPGAWRSTSPRRATRSSRSTRRRRCSRALARARGAGCRSRPSVADARALRPRHGAFGADHRADADGPAARRPGGPRGVPAPRRARTCARRAARAARSPTRSRRFDAERRRAARCPTSREVDGMRLRQPAGRDPRRRRRRRASSASARSSRPTATRTVERRRHPASTTSTPATLEAEGAAAGLQPRAPRRVIPATDDYVGSDGGDARVPERHAARLRALPRPDEHLRRPRQPAAARSAAASGAGSASSSRRPGSATPSTRTPHDLFYLGGGQDRDQALCARGPRRRPSATRCTRRPTRGAVVLARLRRLPAARPRLRARRRASSPASASSTCAPCARTARG